MRTTKAPSSWPAQVTLAGQAAAPDGPVDMTRLYLVHHAFRRDLRAFVSAAQLTPLADREAWRALQARWHTLAEALHHHHGAERAGVWPALHAHAEPEEKRVIDALEAEYAEIGPLMASCAAGFAKLAGYEDDDARAALAVRLCAVGQRLGQHLAHEEREEIALIQKYLSDPEWQAVWETHVNRPMGLGRALRTVPWTAYGAPKEVRDSILRAGGWRFRLIWLLTRRGFRRQQRAAFRYVAGG